ncbi:MAG: UvrD-helicase domain-containing protein [Prosthecobacter sp.]|uniref:UvrD-helicase domain-containing protein n=1 Tax=Prosthecobacter sp. TaxID=1965333 RepID=UPI003BAF1E5C
MNRLRHILVSASAGSGKTYQLVRRHLHLLALGQPPERIAAMTFTRKAAGEFFQRILQRLSVLSQHSEQPEHYFTGMAPLPEQWPEFVDLLRRVTQQLHRLRLGTMDSFFANITACFPLELGLPLGASVMAENEAAQARREALDALLERIHSSRDEHAGRALLEGFKQATFGIEERSAAGSLESWINDHHATWLDSGDGSPWGRLPGLELAEAGHLTAALNDLRDRFVPRTDEGARFFDEFMAEAFALEPGTTLPPRVKYFLDKTTAVWKELKAGRAEIGWGRGKKSELTGETARAWGRVAGAILEQELICRAQRTQGMAALMALYEAEYARRVRSRGRLSFADVQRLLAAATTDGAEWADGESGDLWFRLDGRYDHWLFDEFQDTSRVQWNVVRGLVDEVMQDDTGRRSFYAVGDPKQSIYLWRQAEPGLFDDVLREWPHQDQDGLEPQTLSQSFRSAPAVLDAVNAVFANPAGIEAVLPGCTAGFAFKDHVAAERNQRLSGYAALLSVSNEEGLRNPSTTPTVTALLNEIRPLERGLTCAVLVRGNKNANEVAEELRATTGMEVVCESQIHPATDNAVTLALLSLLQLAAHPGDSLALEHLRMTPLWPQIEFKKQDQVQSWPLTCHQVRESVFERGFVGFTEIWTRHVRDLLPEMDAFHELRLRQFGEMAAEFDAGGSRDIDAFLQHARDMPMQVRGAANAVQVMTVHKAKGLEFDVVILPDLNGDAMDQVRRRSLIVNRDAQGISWVLQEPPRIYAPLHEALDEELEVSKQRSGFESLCRLYVAMTRAKRGLYLIAEPPPKSKEPSMREAQFLRRMLGVSGEPEVGESYLIEWQTGDAQWFATSPGVTPRAPETAVVSRPLGELLREFQPLAKRVTPSGEEDFQVKGSMLFSAGREPGRRLGNLVHELLAHVEWWDATSDMAELESRWQASGLLRGEAVETTALAMVRCVLQSGAAQFAFARPAAEAQSWRERPFDLIHQGSWISGVFDRVVVQRDSVRLIDFKTDEVATEESLAEKVAGYRPQILLYRQALVRLTGLKLEQIESALLFTRNCRLVDVK